MLPEQIKEKYNNMNCLPGHFTPARQISNRENSQSTLTASEKKHAKLDFEPLPLEDIERELREAELNPEFDLSVLDPIVEEEEDLNQCNKENINKQPDILCNSFDLDFNQLITPHKPQLFQYATPNQTQQKVQCSVNMQLQFKTPIQKLVNNNSERVRSCQPAIKTKTQTDKNFPKIYVKDVEYIVLNCLGKGGTSEVWQCYNRETESHRAIKCIPFENSCSARNLINEVNVLKALQNCNRVIKMYDYEIKENKQILMLVLEVGQTDLHKILKEYALVSNSHMPVYKLITYWMDMLYAVKQIHDNGVIHSDLKPANFVQVNSRLKLIDFGIAAAIKSDVNSVIKTVPEGSYNYISPEALVNDTSSINSPSRTTSKYKISLKSDVWSLGCILYQMVYKKPPFHDIKNMSGKLSAIMNPNHQIQYPEASSIPPRIIETIKKCLRFSMRLRPSVADLISEYENYYN